MKAAEASCFFDEGIHFECTRCGNCCTGEPGAVYVTDEEIEAISAHLGRMREAVIIEHTRMVGGLQALQEKPNGDCVYFGDRSCAVYPARPKQCRTWPFWLNNLRSGERWQKARTRCPGIGKGRLFSREEIFGVMYRPGDDARWRSP